jgi:DNA-binding beta-propeller fold protein YncE
MTNSVRFLFLTAAIAVGASSGFHVTDRIKAGGEGGWDYLTVDSAAHRLYVSHSTHVVVIDTEANKVVGDIPDTKGVHGIAVAPELGRGYTSNGGSNNVTIFDLKTLKMIGQVATGQNPDSVRYDSVSGRVFTFNGRSNDSTAIDAKGGTVLGTIPMGGKPEFSVADGKGRIYVNIEDTSEIAEIDTRALKVTKRYSLAPCDGPSGLAIDTANRRLFSVCGNNVMVVSDPDTGKVIATPPIGAGSDGAGFDPGLGLAFSSNGGAGTLTVVRQTGGKYEVQENVPTQRGSRTMTVDPATHKVYLSAAEYGAASGGGRAPMTPGSFMVLVLSQ